MIQHDGVMRERLPFINSLTKYPSIPCWHPMGDRGVMADAPAAHPPGPYLCSEKLDGTNARIILLPGCYLIGSREELLTHSGDVVHNPSQGIVDAVRAIADRVSAQRYESDRPWFNNPLTVIYGEVYGGKVGANAKNYGAATGFRVFDIMAMNADDFDAKVEMHPSQLAAWRDGGGQRFLPHDELSAACERLGLPVVPQLGGVCVPPAAQAEVSVWMSDALIAGVAGGPLTMTPQLSEGLVLRTPDRSWIVKVRREDYEKAARRRPQIVRG